MKKLGKLNINPEKLITKEELVSLRGGYDWSYVSCIDHDTWNSCGGYIPGPGCDPWVMEFYCINICPGSDEAMCL